MVSCVRKSFQDLMSLCLPYIAFDFAVGFLARKIDGFFMFIILSSWKTVVNLVLLY